jgi:threonine/homoserine/homoserine lactone efflux protein
VTVSRRYGRAVVSAEQVVGLAVACVVLLAVPGPSVLFIVGRALSYGRRVALASVLGNTTGCAIAAATVAVGLGPVLQTSETVFQVVKIVGAAYLVWLGVQAWRHSGGATAPEMGERAPGVARAARAGLVVGVTNPKAFVIFAAILPQFVDRGAGHATGQMLLLGLVPVVIGAVTDSVWGVAAAGARRWFAGSARRMARVGRAGGAMMIGLGLSVAVTGHD